MWQWMRISKICEHLSVFLFVFWGGGCCFFFLLSLSCNKKGYKWFRDASVIITQIIRFELCVRTVKCFRDWSLNHLGGYGKASSLHDSKRFWRRKKQKPNLGVSCYTEHCAGKYFTFIDLQAYLSKTWIHPFSNVHCSQARTLLSKSSKPFTGKRIGK